MLLMVSIYTWTHKILVQNKQVNNKENKTDKKCYKTSFLLFLEMGLFPSIEISEIDEGDYESVITIRDDVGLENGKWDFLPDYFDILLKTPETKGFVLKRNKEHVIDKHD